MLTAGANRLFGLHCPQTLALNLLNRGDLLPRCEMTAGSNVPFLIEIILNKHCFILKLVEICVVGYDFMRNNRFAAIICLLLLSTSLFSQTDYTSFWKKVAEDEKHYKDSCRIEFAKRPPVIDIGFEIDRQIIELKKNFDFWYEKDGVRHFPIKVNRGYLIDSIGDCLTFIFRYKKDTMKFEDIKWYRNGAEFRFGKIEKLNKIRNYYIKNSNDEGYKFWSNAEEPYIMLAENNKLKEIQDNIRSIYFLVIYPEVYGDGVVITITKPNLISN